MANIKATFLINDIDDTERFVVNLPEDYPFGPGERIVERQITEEEYNKLLENKDQFLKIYRYTDEHTAGTCDKCINPPMGLNYKTGLKTRLHHKPIIQPNGFLTKMCFFAEVSPLGGGEWKYEDLVIEVDFEYLIDPATDFVYARNKKVTWYKENGEAHPEVKNMYKVYTPLEMDEVAIKRRANVISLIKLTLAKFISDMLASQYPNPSTRPDSNDTAKKIMEPLNGPILAYINGGDLSLIEVLRHSKEPLLNTTMPDKGISVKDYVIGWLEQHG